ncbi:MAG: acetate kinase [Candidatus Cloacimonadota bacterium]|nr:acetate kinase [Candidatus Cloacimonadota bacterium]
MERKKILVINCGSSSLKYDVIAMPDNQSLGNGIVERIGSKSGKLTQKVNGEKLIFEEEIADHTKAFKLMMKALLYDNKGIITSLEDIDGVGHRTVHAGEDYASSVVITEDVVKSINRNINLAPLHNPANLTGIAEAQKMFPNITHVGVFDTAFHQTMPKQAYMYAIPKELYNNLGVRKYGFHGTSHRYVSNIAYEKYNIDRNSSGIVSCHLGNGASICAIENGISIDTSMGMTPLEGLIMGTRSGDLDPGIVFFLHENGYSFDEINNILNNKSGLLGLSGISNDLRDIEDAAIEGSKFAQCALNAYAYRIAKYIGGYSAALVKVNAIIFTGGVGENDVIIREKVCNKLRSIGINFDAIRNIELNRKEGVISAEESLTKIIIIPTNEELQIAKDTYELIS